MKNKNTSSVKKSYIKMFVPTIISIVMGIVLLGGATFSFFSHQSETDFVITAGELKISATAELTSIGSAEWQTDEFVNVPGDVENNAGYFANRGSVMYDGGKNVLKISNMTAGDSAELTITVTNYSSLSSKYRLEVTCTNNTGLWEALTFSCTSADPDLQFIEGTSHTNWLQLAPAESSAGYTLAPIRVHIGLPMDADDAYQGKSCKITISIVAIQANAHEGN